MAKSKVCHNNFKFFVITKLTGGREDETKFYIAPEF